MSTLYLDVRFALRQLTQRPLYSALLIIVLALGIGTTGGMFAVVRGVLLADLPFEDPERLVAVFAPQPDVPDAPFSGPDFLDIKAQSKSFESAAAMSPRNMSLVVDEEAVQINATLVTGEYFETLGIAPARGRVLDAEDETHDRRVAVISDRIFREQLGGDPSAVGRTVLLGGEPFEIVGVLEPERRFGSFWGMSDAWIPLPFTAPAQDPIYTERGSHNFLAIARLKAGVSVESAQTELEGIAARLEEAYPQTNTNVGARVVPLKDQMVGGSRTSLLLLFGAIASVLLLACVNVATLLLSRGAARRPEIAMRAALGASRARLVRQLLTESVVLGLLGGAAGLLVALWALDVFKGFFESSVPLTVLDRVSLDVWTIAATVGIAMVAGVLAGIAPAIATSRPESFEALKEGAARATSGVKGARTRNAFVVAQVAIAIALLSGAGLLMRSFAAVLAVHPGFDPAGVHTAQVSLPQARFADRESVLRYQQAVGEKLKASPGVLSVGTVDRLPQGGWNTNGDIVIEGQPPYLPGESPVVERRRATADYFSTIGIEVTRGRAFTDGDRAGSAPVMIVNEAFARRFFPDEDPVGKRARWDTDQLPFAEIVGVIGDVRSRGPENAVALESFLPFAQHADWNFWFVIKTAEGVDGGSILRGAMRDVDPLQPPSRIQSMVEVTEASVAGRKSVVTLLGAFALVAVVLAALGIYGVVSHQTSQRTREVGIRLALGARPADVVGMILRQSMSVVGLGIVGGVGLAMASSSVLRSFLFGTSPIDPIVYVAVGTLVAVVALVATLVPARRAAAVAPATALRYE